MLEQQKVALNCVSLAVITTSDGYSPNKETICQRFAQSPVKPTVLTAKKASSGCNQYRQTLYR